MFIKATAIRKHSTKSFIALCAAVYAAGAWAGPASPSSASADYRLALWPQRAHSPDFTLVDVNGQKLSLANYRGRVVVIVFGFTRCPDVCPAELFKLALAMKRLGPVSDRVQVLFVSLDPEWDTPKVLKHYVAGFDRRFVGLTGTASEVNQAAANFFVEYARVEVGTGHTIDHSTAVFVCDVSGRLRLLGTPDTSVPDFVHDLTALAAE